MEAVKERSVLVILLSGGQGNRMSVFLLSHHAPNLTSRTVYRSQLYDDDLGVSCVLLLVMFITLV